MNTFKIFIKKLIPRKIFKIFQPVYHGLAALQAHYSNNKPSHELIVIGVTGTAGKSTTVNVLQHILNHNGLKTGFSTTANYSFGDTIQTNKHGMSMPSGPTLQKQLRTMVSKQCAVAVIECTSEGLAQNRHLGIAFDLAVFTNLSEAHLETHGGFANYRAAKGRLFATLAHAVQKNLQSSILTQPESTIIANGDDANAEYYLAFQAQRKVGLYFVTDSEVQRIGPKFSVPGTPITAIPITVHEAENSFEITGETIHSHLIGKFNLYNIALATATAQILGVQAKVIDQTLQTFNAVPGRLEKISNERGITVLVDYAPEPEPLKASLTAVRKMSQHRLIHVFGATGGHRDKAKQFIFGELSARFSDSIIITNDDVYDSDPKAIAENIQSGIATVPPTERWAKDGLTIETILDRRTALDKALSIAQRGDTILVTGKGSEQFLVLPGNNRIAWDDRAVLKELLSEMK